MVIDLKAYKGNALSEKAKAIILETVRRYGEEDAPALLGMAFVLSLILVKRYDENQLLIALREAGAMGVEIFEVINKSEENVCE